MFIEKSRYFGLDKVEYTTEQGKVVSLVKLRRLPKTEGVPATLKNGERLDIVAKRQYSDAAMFWHIADANNALDATDLESDSGEVISIPEK